MFRLSIVCLAVVFLASCGPKPADVARARQQERQRLAEAQLINCNRAIDNSSREALIQHADCITNATNMLNPPDPVDLYAAASIRALGIRYRNGLMTRDEAAANLDLIYAEARLARTRMENERRVVVAQQAQARAANCANVRYRNRTSSNRAIDSTVPAVAILGLFAEIGAMSEEAQACD